MEPLEALLKEENEILARAESAPISVDPKHIADITDFLLQDGENLGEAANYAAAVEHEVVRLSNYEPLLSYVRFMASCARLREVEEDGGIGFLIEDVRRTQRGYREEVRELTDQVGAKHGVKISEANVTSYLIGLAGRLIGKEVDLGLYTEGVAKFYLMFPT